MPPDEAGNLRRNEFPVLDAFFRTLKSGAARVRSAPGVDRQRAVDLCSSRERPVILSRSTHRIRKTRIAFSRLSVRAPLAHAVVRAKRRPGSPGAPESAVALLSFAEGREYAPPGVDRKNPPLAPDQFPAEK